MLYDNGQLATVYAETYRLTGREDFRRVCEELCDFILREMSDKSGGFYAALDADAEDEEGKFYRWEKAEVQKLLTKEEFELFFSSSMVSPESPTSRKNITRCSSRNRCWKMQRALKMKESDLEGQLTPIRKKLLDARNMRPRPLTDTKVLTADNGLMIGGLADGRTHSQKRSLPLPPPRKRPTSCSRTCGQKRAGSCGPTARRETKEAKGSSTPISTTTPSSSTAFFAFNPRNRRQKVAHSRG